MASKTISEYITDLENNKDLLVDTLISKGVSANYNMGYSELVTLVDTISGGDGIYKVNNVKDLENISTPKDGDIALIQIYQEPRTETGNLNVDAPGVVNASNITFPSAIIPGDLNNIMLVINSSGSQINVSGVSDKSGNVGLVTITTSNLTWTSGSISIKILDDETVVSATYTYVTVGGTFQLSSSQNLDSNLTYTSETLSNINFQNFEVGSYWGTVVTTSVLFKLIGYTNYIPGKVIGYSGIYKYDGKSEEWINAMPEPTVPEKIQTGIYDSTRAEAVDTFMGIGSLFNTFDTNLDVNKVDFSMTCATGRPYDYDENQLTGYRLECIGAFAGSGITSLEARSSFLINKDRRHIISAPVYLFMSSMFYECSNLTTIDNLDSLPNNDVDFMMGNLSETFYGCTDLDSNITISLVNPYLAYNSGLYKSSSIGGIYTMTRTFYNCNSLKNVRIAWCGSNSNPTNGVSELFLGTGIMLRLDSAFNECTSLEVVDLSYIKLIYNSQVVVTLNNTTFANVPSTCKIYVYDNEDRNYLTNYFNGTIVVGHSDSSLWNDVPASSGGSN